MTNEKDKLQNIREGFEGIAKIKPVPFTHEKDVRVSVDGAVGLKPKVPAPSPDKKK